MSDVEKVLQEFTKLEGRTVSVGGAYTPTAADFQGTGARPVVDAPGLAAEVVSLREQLAAATARAAELAEDSERWRAFVQRAEVSLNEDGEPCIYSVLDIDDITEAWADKLADGSIDCAEDVQAFWDDWGNGTAHPEAPRG